LANKAVYTIVEQKFIRPCDRRFCRWRHVTKTATRTTATPPDGLSCRWPIIFTSTTLPVSPSLHCITSSWRHWSSVVRCCAREDENSYKISHSFDHLFVNSSVLL